MTRTPQLPRRSLLPRLALLSSLALLSPGTAHANPWELFGFTPRAQGMGAATTAIADDLSAIYYNPAAMVGHSKAEFGLSLSADMMNLHVSRTKASTVETRTSLPDSQARAELAVIFPLGGAILKDRVVIGLSLGHPVGSLIRVQTVDEAHPQFYMYQSKPQRFASALNVGIKIVNGLSIGLGAQVIAEQIASVTFKLDVAAKRFAARDITVDLNTKPKLMASMLLEPSDWLRIGFSWRQEASLYYTQPTVIDLGEIGAITLDVSGTAQYWPHVFSLGVGVKPGKAWLVSLQCDYMLFAKAPRDQVQVTMTPSGPVLDGLGLSDILGFSAQDPVPGLSNIFWPRVGVEYSPTEFLVLRGGAWVRPAVTPDQTGGTNYLDNFSESVSLGLSYKFIDPLKVFTEAVSLDLAGSAIFANERTHAKKQSTDATGSASFGGAVWSFGAGLRYVY